MHKGAHRRLTTAKWGKWQPTLCEPGGSAQGIGRLAISTSTDAKIHGRGMAAGLGSWLLAEPAPRLFMTSGGKTRELGAACIDRNEAITAFVDAGKIN
jgi:hypothetical protein